MPFPPSLAPLVNNFLKYLFIFIYLLISGCWVFIAVHGLSLAVESRGYSLVALHGLLIVVASLVVESGL